MSYYEIAGQIIETGLHVQDAFDWTFQSPMDLLPVVTPPILAIGVAVGVAAKAAGKEDYSAFSFVKGLVRLRGAKAALTAAAMLAAADGPLPVGDVLAIGLLGAYATGQIVSAAGDIIQ